jgi:hypothetical protein
MLIKLVLLISVQYAVTCRVIAVTKYRFTDVIY